MSVVRQLILTGGSSKVVAQSSRARSYPFLSTSLQFKDATSCVSSEVTKLWNMPVHISELIAVIASEALCKAAKQALALRPGCKPDVNISVSRLNVFGLAHSVLKCLPLAFKTIIKTHQAKSMIEWPMVAARKFIKAGNRYALHVARPCFWDKTVVYVKGLVLLSLMKVRWMAFRSWLAAVKVVIGAY